MRNKIKTNARQKIGEHLKKIREDSAVSKYKINKEYGLSSQAVAAIEKGSKNYTIDNLMIYITAIGCDLYIMNDEQPDGNHAILVKKIQLEVDEPL